jgi:hypothetical protein
MKRFFAFLFCFFYLFNAPFTIAQLNISKDHIACAYGLKNKANEWVISPSFLQIIAISLDQGILYQTQSKEGFWGLLDSKGVVLIPSKYDKISCVKRSSPYVFTLQKGTLFGAINEAKKSLAIKYTKIELDGENLLLHDAKQNTYIDAYFKVLIPPQNIFFKAFKNHSLSILSKKGTATVRYGLINQKGMIIIPPKYDKIIRCKKEQKLILLKKEQRVAVCDYKGNPLTSYAANLIGFNYCTGCKHHETTLFKEGNFYGLMKCDGSVLIPPKYDNIHPIKGSFILSKGAYQGLANSNYQIILPLIYTDISLYSNIFWVQKNHKKYGLYTLQGKQILAPIYDSIQATRIKSFHATNYSQKYLTLSYDNKKGIFDLQDKKFITPIDYDDLFLLRGSTMFLTKKKDHYGLVTPDQIIPPKYTHFTQSRDPSSDFIFLIDSMQKIIAYDRLSSKKIAYKIKQIDPTCLLLTTNMQSQWQEKAYHIFHFDSTYQATFYYNYEAAPSIENFVLIGNTIYKKKDASYQLEKDLFSQTKLSFDTYVVRTSNHKYGIFNFRKEHFIIPPTFMSFNVQSWKENKIWIKETEGFLLCDTLANRHLDDYFVRPFLKQTAYPRLSNQKLGKLDYKTFKWVIPPVYAHISPLGDNKHLVRTKTNKYGLASDLKDTLLLDTIHLGVLHFLNSPRIGSFHQILFDNNNNPVLYKNSFYTSNRDSIRQHIFYLLESLGYLSYLQNPQNSSIQSLKNKAIEVPFIETLLKICHSNFRPEPQIQPLYSDEKYSWYPSIKMLNQHSLVIYITQTLESYSGDDFLTYTHQYSWMNYTFLKGNFQQVDIMDVFGNNRIFEKELLEAIQSSNYLDLDCSTIENWRIQIGESFELSEKGVFLYLENYKDPNQPYSFLIPWSNLLKYPETTALAEQFLDNSAIETLLSTFNKSEK